MKEMVCDVARVFRWPSMALNSVQKRLHLRGDSESWHCPNVSSMKETEIKVVWACLSFEKIDAVWRCLSGSLAL